MSSLNVSCLRCLKRNEGCTIRVLQLSFLAICLTGFIMQSYDSFVKYLSCPQGVEISTQNQANIDFPSITFCPNHNGLVKVRDPEAYDNAKLEPCGIDLLQSLKKYMIMTNGSNCGDPVHAWKMAIAGLNDFGIIQNKLRG